MATKNKKSKNKNHAGEIILSIFVVAVICFGVLAIMDRQKQQEVTDKKEETVSAQNNTDITKETAENTATEDTETENTEAENTAVEDEGEQTSTYDEKDDYEAGQKTTEIERTNSGKKAATVVLKVVENDKKVILSGSVTNFKQEGGKCTYILTNGSETQTMPSSVIPDAKYTVCEAILIEKINFNSGTWTVKLEYQSNDAEGTSETQTFNI